MRQNSRSQGYQEVTAGGFAGAIVGVVTARLMAALLVGVAGLTSLQLQPVLLSNTLLLLLPPLTAATAYAIALHLAGASQVGPSALCYLLLSPFASWLLWEAQQGLGTAELWPLRIVPVVLLTALAPVAHGLSRTLVQFRGTSSENLARRRQEA